MKICKTIAEIRQLVKGVKSKGLVVGIVPTMGALHDGHLSLVKASNKSCDVTIASIFVNPAQFNNSEDLAKYPRTIEDDLKKLESAKCYAVFIPDETELYPNKTTLAFDFGAIGNQLEGRFRPGHFNGVGLVVSKLFNIIQPDRAFFGQKDLQQFFIIKALRDQLNFPIKLTMVPTMREKNGLAMSSRNMRLSSEDFNEAAMINATLQKARKDLISGKKVSLVKSEVKELFESNTRFRLEYFEVISTNDFKPVNKIDVKESVALCIAAEIGQVRLIDNLMLIS